MELKRTLKKSTFTPLLTLISFFSVVMLIGLSMDHTIYTSEHTSTLQSVYAGRTFFKISWSIDTRQFFENLNTPEQALNIREARNALDNHELFELHTSVTQSIPFPRESNILYRNEFLAGYEIGQTLPDFVPLIEFKGVVADRYFWNHPFVNLEVGRAFTHDEYYLTALEDSIQPIVLGYEWNNLYGIGDKIEGSVFIDGVTTTFEVVGFLERDSHFRDNNNNLIMLNRYMIIPYLDLTYTPSFDEEEFDQFFQRTYSWNLVNARIVCDDKNASDVSAFVNHIFLEHELFDFELFDESDKAHMGMEISRQRTILALTITVIVTLISGVSLILSVFNKVYKEIKNYSIYRLLGMKKRTIYLMSVLDTAITVVVANVLAYSVFMYMQNIGIEHYMLKTQVLVVIFAVEFVVLSVSLLIVRRKIYNTDLSSVIRGKE
jgi:ABC-type antimicrobial peptide transport system permease subunit